jgi:predicted outer membrane protein
VLLEEAAADAGLAWLGGAKEVEAARLALRRSCRT